MDCNILTLKLLSLKMYVATLILSLTLFVSFSLARDDFIISACENEYINIGCKGGQILNIRKAIYCYHNTIECCGSDFTSHVVTGLCQNKTHCHFQVNRYLFGEQCNNLENNITIYYTCEDRMPENSSNRCKINEVWSTATSICPKMCPSQYQEPENCPVDEGCVCIKDYVLDRNTMRCIPEIYCPQIGEKNEKFSRCRAESQRYCPGPIEIPKEVYKDCIPGYICDKCLYRNMSGYCIPFEECPKLRG